MKIGSAFRPPLVEVTGDLAALKRVCEADIVREPHFHVIRYPGPEVLSGPIHDRWTADRIACEVSISHPDVQTHVRFCRGHWCRAKAVSA